MAFSVTLSINHVLYLCLILGSFDHSRCYVAQLKTNQPGMYGKNGLFSQRPVRMDMKPRFPLETMMHKKFDRLVSKKKLLMINEDDDKSEKLETSVTEVDATDPEAKIENVGADGKLLKNFFIMTPLILKFTIVLLVKFLTDVVVFPLLFLYRISRMTKNKLSVMLDKSGKRVKNR